MEFLEQFLIRVKRLVVVTLCSRVLPWALVSAGHRDKSIVLY